MRAVYVREILQGLLSGQCNSLDCLYQTKNDMVMMPLIEWGGHIVFVWLVGLMLGWMLPRPKLVSSRGKIWLLGDGMPGRLWMGRMALAWNGLLLCREIWYRFCSPGTFRSMLRAVAIALKKRIGLRDAWLLVCERTQARGVADGCGNADESDSIQWYVSLSDLKLFQDAVDTNNAGEWEKMFEKSFEGCSYVAWRRRRPNGRTEYKSITIAENATCNEFMDFYLDDDTRPKWDGLVSTHDLLESAYGVKDRCQVVRWIRSFPFAFISDREYVIARRVFHGCDKKELYGITKSIEHPSAPLQDGVVRMHDFYSMWRSRTVPCPKGTDRPACETTLLHYEDFGIPENLARFAVRHGMGGFVSNMVPYMSQFIANRRSRCKPSEFDSEAYGLNITPKFPSNLTDQTAQRMFEKTSLKAERMRRSASARNIGCMVLATGVAALAFSRSPSTQQLLCRDHSTEKIKHRRHPHGRSRRHRHIYKGLVFTKTHAVEQEA